MNRYDVAIIGAGSAGLTAAFTAAGFGKKTLLIDRRNPGGECTWHGCIPSKALINEAKKVHSIKSYVPDFKYKTEEAMKHVHEVREAVYKHEDPNALKQAGIEFLQGVASFKDSKTLLVNGREIRAKKYLIATGATAWVPVIEGENNVPYLTNETLFELNDLPRSMLVLGGGAIGVELAQAMCRLGVHVKLVEMQQSLLFREESALVEPLQNQLAVEGVEIYTGAKAIKFEKMESGVRLYYDQYDALGVHLYEEGPDKTRFIEADTVLIAIGRKANVEALDLDSAGIKYNRKGIQVNRYMQTSQPHIYAIGDVVGPYQFSHMANLQGITAVQNALLPIKRRVRYEHTAWVTFTDPELGRAGMTEIEARAKYGDRIRVYNYDFNQLDRARTKGKTIERLKLILDHRGKVVGLSILAERAGEMICEVQVLKSLGHPFHKMADVIHPYPTYSEVFSKLGKQVKVDTLLNNPMVKYFRKDKSK